MSPVWVSQDLVGSIEFVTFDVYFRELRSLVEEEANSEVATSDQKSFIRAVCLSSVRVAMQFGLLLQLVGSCEFCSRMDLV